MLKECLEIFKKEYEKKGEGYITDSYTLPEASYILIDENGNIEDKIEVSKKDKDKTGASYEYFAQRDYLSKLVDMNKPMDPAKIIHSNNYLSFFVKKENLKIVESSGKRKLTNEIIDKYYDLLSEPREKYTKKDKKKMYESVEKKYGKANVSEIERNRRWIKENVFSILEKVKDDKNYVKIFFKKDIDTYQKESEKYIIPSIYNCNDYNVLTDNGIVGLPNDNMGANSKKPYLMNKSRKNVMPYLVSTTEVFLQKKFFDLLMNYACEGDRNIYVADGWIKNKPNDNFTGYFLRIQKGKEVEIHDFDVITGFKQKIDGLIVDLVIPINYLKLKQSLDYGRIKDIRVLEKNISDVFFNKFLVNNYFMEAKDIKLNDFKVKEMLLKSRKAFFNLFYKGNSSIIKNIFEKISLEIIKNSICNGYFVKAAEQFNLRCALIKYFKGGDDNMADMLGKLVQGLREKMNVKTTGKIQSDEEYYFGVGQLTNYLISLNKSNKKMHSLINPILNCKSDERLKQEIEKLFKKYNYTIQKGNKRFNNLFAMVLSYKAEGKIKSDILTAGYLYSNLIYETKKENDNEEEN